MTLSEREILRQAYEKTTGKLIPEVLDEYTLWLENKVVMMTEVLLEKAMEESARRSIQKVIDRIKATSNVYELRDVLVSLSADVSTNQDEEKNEAEAH